MIRCEKCNDTGYLPRRFYTVARPCNCAVGAERASWDTLTADEQNERAAAEAVARRVAWRGRR